MKERNRTRRTFLKAAGGGSAAAAGIMLPQPKIARAAKTTGSGKLRIMVGGFHHETNTFNPHKSDVEDFKQGARYGDDIIKRRGGCTGGFIDIAEMYDVELIGSISAGSSQGMVTKEAFDYVTGVMLDTLDKHQVDAVYLDLHGGGVSEEHPDLEGSTLELVRKKVGPDIPIVFTMDLHCAVTKLMTEVADAVSIYRTYPHVDGFECGQEVGVILFGTLHGKIKPVMAVSKPPLMMGPPLNVVTADMPIKLVYDRAREMQRTIPGVLSVCPAHGFMQQDCPDQGVGVLVTVDRDRVLAQKLADEIGDMLFKYRKEFWVHLPDAAEAIHLAMQPSDKPFAVSDGGDNIGAGTPGDGTALLREALKQRVDSAFAQIRDAEAVKKAVQAGIGATVTLDVGGKSDPMYGPPVTITGKVGVISEDKQSVRIDIKGIALLINSDRYGPNSLGRPHAMGIYPEKFHMSLCKGGFAFRPVFPADKFNYIMAETPGYSSTDLKQFKYTKIRRPIFPLDDI